MLISEAQNSSYFIFRNNYFFVSNGRCNHFDFINYFHLCRSPEFFYMNVVDYGIYLQCETDFASFQPIHNIFEILCSWHQGCWLVVFSRFIPCNLLCHSGMHENESSKIQVPKRNYLLVRIFTKIFTEYKIIKQKYLY
ncbi:hypothetical protein Hanom_Chr10g00923081 [Helianthus anomalus]